MVAAFENLNFCYKCRPGRGSRPEISTAPKFSPSQDPSGRRPSGCSEESPPGAQGLSPLIGRSGGGMTLVNFADRPFWNSNARRVELLRQLHRKSSETNAESSLRPRFGGITGRGLSIAAPAVNERGRQLRRPMSRRLSWAEFAAAAALRLLSFRTWGWRLVGHVSQCAAVGLLCEAQVGLGEGVQVRAVMIVGLARSLAHKFGGLRAVGVPCGHWRPCVILQQTLSDK